MMTRRALSRTCLIECLLAALLFFCAPVHAAPQAESAVTPQAVSPGDTVSYSITVSWHGDADRYMIVPPQPELPEAVELVSSSFASSSRENLQRMLYQFVLRPAREGDHVLKPVSIKYWARGEQQESTILTGEQAFKALRFSLLRNRPALMLGAAAGLCLLVCAALLLVLIKKRRAARSAAAARTARGPDSAGLLQSCRQAKLRGDYALFYESAIALARALAEPDGIKADGLAALLEKARFGGFRPPAEDIERLMRQLEKSVAAAGSTAGEHDYKKYCRTD